ncbi:MAG: threonylcarbamoyl-AMP synthase [Firmicutes bacterium]|nr:threonylcarbamoyl-AMP synthase [Bacillota bacterium]
MATRILKVDPRRPDPDALAEAGAVIRRGGLVAFPTETVYGLGASALDPEAVRRIFAAKGRPADNPLIVHVADAQDLDRVVREVPAVARELMARFWPGPLSLALPRRPEVPDAVTAGLPTVGVRMPDHPVALGLIRAAGVPIAAPSANLSGRPSPTRAEHVLEDLDGRVDLILDGGETGVGLESTFVDLTARPPVLCRPGGITLAQLAEVLGEVRVDPAVLGKEPQGPPRSPGQKYAHYAPRAPVVLVEGPLSRVQERIRSLIAEEAARGRRVGVLASAESRGLYPAPVVVEVGSRSDLARVAANLFAALRSLDAQGADIILAEGFPEEGIGLAIMNRLRKAAGQVVRVGGEGEVPWG